MEAEAPKIETPPVESECPGCSAKLAVRVVGSRIDLAHPDPVCSEFRRLRSEPNEMLQAVTRAAKNPSALPFVAHSRRARRAAASRRRRAA